jgi:hypothetical protein
MSFGSANYLLNDEGVALPVAAPSKQFLVNLMLHILNYQNKKRIDTL